jgi:hypothetical protein
VLKDRIERQRNKLGVREHNLCGCVCLDWAKVSYSAQCPLSYTVKKLFDIPVPSRDATYQILPRRDNLYMTSLFSPRGSLVSDIPAVDGNIKKLFYGVLSSIYSRVQ